MTEIEKLRALIAEAREHINTEWDSNLKMIARIDAALAEPVVDEGTQRLIDAVCHYRAKAIMLGAKPSDMITAEDRLLCQQTIPADIATAFDVTDVWDDLEKATRERDEARAEVEKLRALLTDARDYIVAPCGHGDYYIIQRINAALAELPSGDMRPDVAEQRQVRGK